MRLVYVSPVPWESFAQRPHKFVHWFHNRTGEPVLWIDPYPTRFLQLSDLTRLRTSPTLGLSDNRPSWLKVLKPMGLPIEPLPGSGWVNRCFWRSTLDIVDNFTNSAETLFVIGKPSILALILLRRLHHCFSLYDAMDSFPAFYKGISRLAIARREILVAQRVDVILVSSMGLMERWKRYHNDVRLVYNALDLSAQPALKMSFRPSARKIFGYVGTIASWFDWDWVSALAKVRTEDEIRLIGPVLKPSNKPLPDNIIMLPACTHREALKAMMEFDVGLIPFKQNELTDSVDPIKYYEYRALALPVISTGFGEMRYRSSIPGVFISQSAVDVFSLAESALQFERSLDDANEFAQQNTWEARFDAAGLFL